MRPLLLFLALKLSMISPAWAYSSEHGWLECVPLKSLPYGAECPGRIQDFLSAPELQEELNQAFHQYGLLIWKGQKLHPREEIAFMKLLPCNESAMPIMQRGPLGAPGIDREKYNRWRIPGHEEILLEGEGTIENHFGISGNLSSGKAALEWHTDGVYDLEAPPVATSLYSVSVKPKGGDTLFMSGVGIYQSVDSDLHDFLDGMTVQYIRKPKPMHKSGYRAQLSSEYEDEALTASLGTLYDDVIEKAPGLEGTAHPLVWKHHPTGRHAVIVAPMWAHHVVDKGGVGWTEDESQALFENLLSRGIKSEYRHQWQVGDFVVWDNRQVLHSATPDNDFSKEGLRLLHRIRMCGDRRPVSPLAK